MDFDRTFPHLAADPYAKAALAADIGRKVRYRIPKGKVERAEFIREYGTLCRETFEIIGVQLTWDRRLVYRVKCLAHDDQFGRPLDPCLAIFVEDPK